MAIKNPRATVQDVIAKANNATFTANSTETPEVNRVLQLIQKKYDDMFGLLSTTVDSHEKAIIASSSSASDGNDPTLEQILDDDWLTKTEKPTFIKIYHEAIDDHDSLIASANLYGIIGEKENYETAYTVLVSFVTSLNPKYDDTTQNTYLGPGGGKILLGYFKDLYKYRGELRAAIDAIINGIFDDIFSDDKLTPPEKRVLTTMYQSIKQQQNSIWGVIASNRPGDTPSQIMDTEPDVKAYVDSIKNLESSLNFGLGYYPINSNDKHWDNARIDSVNGPNYSGVDQPTFCNWNYGWKDTHKDDTLALGTGNGAKLRSLFMAVNAKAVLLQLKANYLNTILKISSDATDLMSKWLNLAQFLQYDSALQKYVLGARTTIGPNYITSQMMAADTIFAKNLVVGNFDNYIPNFNSEMDYDVKDPSKPWPDTSATSPDYESRLVVKDLTNSRSGTRCRLLSPGQTLVLTKKIAVVSEENYYFEAWCKGGKPKIEIRLNGETASSLLDPASCMYKAGTDYGARIVPQNSIGSTSAGSLDSIVVNASDVSRIPQYSTETSDYPSGNGYYSRASYLELVSDFNSNTRETVLITSVSDYVDPNTGLVDSRYKKLNVKRGQLGTTPGTFFQGTVKLSPRIGVSDVPSATMNAANPADQTAYKKFYCSTVIVQANPTTWDLNTKGLPTTVKSIEFIITNTGTTPMFVDDMYARKMLDARLLCDGIIEASKILTAELRSVLITGDLIKTTVFDVLPDSLDLEMPWYANTGAGMISGSPRAMLVAENGLKVGRRIIGDAFVEFNRFQSASTVGGLAGFSFSEPQMYSFMWPDPLVGSVEHRGINYTWCNGDRETFWGTLTPGPLGNTIQFTQPRDSFEFPNGFLYVIDNPLLGNKCVVSAVANTPVPSLGRTYTLKFDWGVPRAGNSSFQFKIINTRNNAFLGPFTRSYNTGGSGYLWTTESFNINQLLQFRNSTHAGDIGCINIVFGNFSGDVGLDNFILVM